MFRFLRSLDWHWNRIWLRIPDGTARGISRRANAAFRAATETKRILEPYERLASVYFEFSRSFCPRYDRFLPAIARRFSLPPIQRVLELACGAGTLTAKLAGRFEVLATDANSLMLEEARKNCAVQPAARFAHADFRQFYFDDCIDAIVCASDSLNYLAHPAELEMVMRCASEQLAGRGCFVFDALGEQTMRSLAEVDSHFRSYGVPFAMWSTFDDEDRRCTTRVIFVDGIEVHHRVPIEVSDVERAARIARLTLVDRFSDGFRDFYVAGSRRS